MDNNVVIKVDNVSKKYCKSLKRSMIYGMTDIGRNMLRLSSHSNRLRPSDFWAVKDISFELKRGETLGLIGPNGSGKTTLLKMLNGIFWPDKGKISIKGRIGALIAVGAGFHPNFTGRENIYVNGAILGMSKNEINKKFDSIVDFADIGDFLDTPVKNYSSGMFVRLGFAIAVHSEPDILLVDEVLAVGDSVFTTKCYRRMNEIKKRENVAIVFVSHNLLTVERFCNRGIFLNNGTIKTYGGIYKVIQDYQVMANRFLNKEKGITGVIPGIPYCTREVEITSVKYLNKDGKEKGRFAHGDKFGIRVEYQTDHSILNPIFQISLSNGEGVHISTFGSHLDNIQIDFINGHGAFECWIDTLPLLLNKYYVNVAIYDKTHNITFDYWNGSISNKYFQVLPNRISAKMAEYTAICHFTTRWVVNKRNVNIGAI